MNAIVCRLADASDLRQLADLRWRLQTGDAEEISSEARHEFLSRYVQAPDHSDPLLTHFVAENNNTIVGAMSVRKVRKLPAPGRPVAYWGYLTNSYVRAEYRNQAAGSALLSFVKHWAKDEALEFIVVWPSERAYPFYERSGFRRDADPLVLNFDDS